MGHQSLRSRLSRSARRTVHTLRHRAMAAGLLPGHTGYVRFICIGYGRTGSTLLMRSLDSHSHIAGYGEIVKNIDRYPRAYPEFEHSQALFARDPAAFLQKRVFGQYPPHIGAVGFKIFYHHAPRDTAWGRAVWDYLLRETDVRVLHLKRRNTLKTLLSAKQAGETEEWIKYSAEADAVRIDCGEAEAFFAQMAAWEAEYDTLFAAHPRHEIIYEQLTRDLPGQLRDVQAFLGVPYEIVSPGTEKRPSRSLSSQIENYAELKEYFRATPWAEYFASD